MEALENQLKEARFLAEEADRKYDEARHETKRVPGVCLLVCTSRDHSEHLDWKALRQILYFKK